MALTRRRRRAIGLQVFGVLAAGICIAAGLGWTPPLVHPWLVATISIATLVRGAFMYRDKDQSDF